MNPEKVINPLMVLFALDQNLNGGPSHITDMVILNIKSLMPSEEYVAVNIDYNRYSEEIKLWQYYRHGENTSLMNVIYDIDSSIYWLHHDDTAYYRILPIILTNKDFSVIKREVIRNILFTIGNIEVLIEALLLSKLIYCLMQNEVDIINRLKEEVINFSQIEFIDEFKKYIRIPIESYKGNYSVEFEKQKILALNTLNLIFSSKFKVLEDCIRVLSNNTSGKTIAGKCISSWTTNEVDQVLDLDEYYRELAVYIYKLRNGRINPEALKIKKYYLPDVFQFKEGQVFHHSLLNRCRVISRKEIDNKIMVELETKSGIYRFKNN